MNCRVLELGSRVFEPWQNLLWISCNDLMIWYVLICRLWSGPFHLKDHINGDFKKEKGLISFLSWYVCVCVCTVKDTCSRVIHEDWQAFRGRNRQMRWRDCVRIRGIFVSRVRAWSYSMGIHSLMFIHKYQCDCRSCFSS